MKKDVILKYYQKYKLYIFPTVVALSSLILIIFVIYPQTAKLIANQKVEGDIRSKSNFLEVKAQTLESYDPEDLNKQVNFTLNAYPTEKDFIPALSLLQNLISQSGFSSISTSFGAASVKSANTQSYSIKLDLLGPLSFLQDLLNNIEDSPRLMRISNVEAVGGGDRKVANISLEVEVLYSSAPTEFGSIDSPLPELSQKDQEVIVKLARLGTVVNPLQITPQLGPRGKVNPFE